MIGTSRAVRRFLLALSFCVLACEGGGDQEEGDECVDLTDCPSDLDCHRPPGESLGKCVKRTGDSCKDGSDCWDSLGDCQDENGDHTDCDPQIDIVDVEIEDLPDHIAITVGVAAEIIDASPDPNVRWDLLFEDASKDSCIVTITMSGGNQFECNMQGLVASTSTTVVPDGQNNVCEVSSDGGSWRAGFDRNDCVVDVTAISVSSRSESAGGVFTDSFIADLTAGDSGGGGEKPVVLDPCAVFTESDIEALSGTPMVEASTVDSENRKVCDYRPVTGSGTRMVVEAQLNTNAAGLFATWQSQRSDATEIRAVTWSPEGEIRITPTDGGTASLWAYVLNDDPLGRDVFIWVESQPYTAAGGGTPADIGTLTTALESVSETLNDAILAAQP